jgi:hypothetical protein
MHLRAVAQRVGDAFASERDVSAILVFGSVASGAVDAFSDVDLLIISRSAVLPLTQRASILRSLGSNWRFGQPQEESPFCVVDADGQVSGELVSVHYQTVAWIDSVLSTVVTHGAITTAQLPFRPYTLPALLQRGWVLLDRDGDLTRWRDMSATYPPLLRRNIIRHVVPGLLEHVDELNRTAERDLGARSFIFFLNAAVDELTSLLFALNDVYDPADRRMHTIVVPFLPYLPASYVATMNDILEGPFDRDGARHRAKLLDRLATDAVRQAHDVLGAAAFDRLGVPIL